jgi:transcriptional regulator with XRE-family HTH domain
MKLQKLRKSRGLTQEEFSEIMNVSRQAVSKWESGQSLPEIDKLIEISDYFGVTIDYLIREEAEIPNKKYVETIFNLFLHYLV